MLKNRLNLSQKSLILVAVPLVFELTFIAMLSYLLHEAETETKKQSHARAIVETGDQIEKTYYEAGSSIILYAQHRSPITSKRFEELLDRLAADTHTMESEVQNEPRLTGAVKGLALLNGQTMEILRELKNNYDVSARPFAFFDEMELERRLMALLHNSLAMLHEIDLAVASSPAMNPSNQEHSRNVVKEVLALGVVLNIVLAIALALLFQRSTASRLRVIMENIDRFGHGWSLRQPLEGTDEIAVIDGTFHKMASSLKQLEQQRKDFVEMVSHDLRTPLNSFLVFMSLLAKDKLGSVPSAVKTEAEDAENELKRLICLINSLLDVEKSEVGELNMNRQNANLSEIIERSIKAVSNLAQDRRIAIARAIEDVQINVDHLRLTQVLVNLLSNALKFTTDGGTIRISTSVASQFVQVEVADEGPGIPNEKKAQIFDRYYSTAADGVAAGLGLAICKSIIDEHGGSIGVRNNDAKGCTFWFRLPTQTAPVVPQSACNQVSP